MDLQRNETDLARDSSGATNDSSAAAAQLLPRWDAMRRELVVDGQIVKRFRLPAVNQEAVLTAFEEEGWPARIFDPLPPQLSRCSKRRLNETIKALNRSHLARIIRFRGDGTGEGVLWEWFPDWR